MSAAGDETKEIKKKKKRSQRQGKPGERCTRKPKNKHKGDKRMGDDGRTEDEKDQRRGCTSVSGVTAPQNWLFEQ